MIYSEAKTSVRSAIAEPTAGFWADSDIGEYINSGIHAMCESKGLEDVKRIVISDDNRMGLPDETKIIEGIYLWEIDAKLTLVETAPAAPTDGDYYVKPSTMVFYTYSSTTGLWTVDTSITRKNLWTDGKVKEIKDNYIELTESLSGLLEIYIYRFPVGLVNDSDEMELPDAYCQGVLAYAKAQAFLKDDNFPQYDRQMSEFARIRLAWEGERVHKNSHFTNRWL
jgi:hypothetical protein